MSLLAQEPALQAAASQTNNKWVIAALYQFRDVLDPATLKKTLDTFVLDHGLCGTLIVATEGINGTVAGSRHAIDLLHALLLAEGFDNLEYKESFSDEQPFRRVKVKHKKEIVTLGVSVKPTSTVGHYLSPQEWNEMLKSDDVIVVDTRNSYEYKAGTFKNAIDPETRTFRAFPDYVKQNLADKKDKKIAMFCTGGIRCEKSTSLLLQDGFQEVYHLKGGILNYLKEIPPEDSLWEGECFVFDERVGVSYDVSETKSQRCYGCGWPLTAEEMQLDSYERGVSCTYCVDKTDDAQKARYRMRQSQHDKQFIATQCKAFK